MSVSYYNKKLEDKAAVYFDSSLGNIDNSGREDVSDILQKTIDDLVKKNGYGIIMVPSGKYLLSKTIMIPKAVRIIGYGDSRPEFILMDNAPGFDKANEEDKGGYRYLFWFINIGEEGIEDANPGTFYSAMTNVDVYLGENNPWAVAFRTHYAQHCFLTHMEINVMSGMAGIYDVGNEIEDIKIIGGKYGIITTKTSPGWPFVMVDTAFINQSVAAIKTHEAGFTIVRSYCRNTANFIWVDDNYFEKIYIENSIFEDMNSVLCVAMEDNQLTHIYIEDSQLKSVENIIEYRDTERNIANDDYQSYIKKYMHGTVASDQYPLKQKQDQVYRYTYEINYDKLVTDIPIISCDNAVNAVELGLVGDGKTDNTEKLKEIIEKYDNIYFPQGIYLIKDSIKLRENVSLWGLHPYTTQIKVNDNTEKFTNFSKPKPMIETSSGKNIISGIGIDAGARNPRICGILWKANKDSYMSDVKFLGGHGYLNEKGEFDTPYDEGRVRDKDYTRKWDYQYPSLIITGGGVIKDIWSASPYASAGLEIRKSIEGLKIYCMSLEHHCRCELRIMDSKNVTIYGFQSEEEKAEGEFARPIEIHNSENIKFATAYFFRTVFVDKPYDYCVKTYNSKNIRFINVHNFSQMKYTISNFLYDATSNKEIRAWQAVQVKVVGEKLHTENKLNQVIIEEKDDKKLTAESITDKPIKLYDGFRFPDGACSDNKGNFYFLDSLDKRVFKIDGETLELSQIFESPFKINSIGFDTRDNILLVAEYSIPEEATLGGVLIENKLPEDSEGTSYGFWYDNRAYTMVLTIDADGYAHKLEKINIGDIKPQRVLYPGNRWRDGGDCKEVLTYNPKQAFLAPDGVTIIPCHYDLIRANNLARSKPGRKLYSVDELYKRVFMCDITEDGLLENPQVIIEEGDFRVRKLNERIYVGDEHIKVYSDEMKYMYSIEIPDRPITFDFGGKSRNLIFVTTVNGVYVVKEK